MSGCFGTGLPHARPSSELAALWMSAVFPLSGRISTWFQSAQTSRVTRLVWNLHSVDLFTWQHVRKSCTSQNILPLTTYFSMLLLKPHIPPSLVWCVPVTNEKAWRCGKDRMVESQLQKSSWSLPRITLRAPSVIFVVVPVTQHHEVLEMLGRTRVWSWIMQSCT